MRKHDSIDLLKLYSQSNNKAWNSFLTTCFKNRDINTLARTRYQVQAGMDDLAKKKLNTEDINVWYCRIMKSLEITAKRIIKTVNPMPGDNPLKAKEFGLDALTVKRNRDRELQKFFLRSSY